jgi:hypothetical protein
VNRKGPLGTLLLITFIVLAIGTLSFVVLRTAKYRARRLTCYYHMGSILFANRQYAEEHGTGYQTNLICLSNQLSSPRKLVCVDDEARCERLKKRYTYGSPEHWASLTMDNCSYQVFLKDSNTLVLRCPIHHIGLYMQQGMTNPSWRGEDGSALP